MYEWDKYIELNEEIEVWIYRDKILEINWKRFAITWNTKYKIFIQDWFDVNINEWDSYKIYDVKNSYFILWNVDYIWEVEQNNYQEIFKWRWIIYNLDSWYIKYSYNWVFTKTYNEYNKIFIWKWINWIKSINNWWDELLFAFWNWKIYILDFIWNWLWIVKTYNVENEIYDIIQYWWWIIYLSDDWIYNIDWSKINIWLDMYIYTYWIDNTYLSNSNWILLINNVKLNNTIEREDKIYNIWFDWKRFYTFENYFKKFDFNTYYCNNRWNKLYYYNYNRNNLNKNIKLITNYIRINWKLNDIILDLEAINWFSTQDYLNNVKLYYLDNNNN